jgi:hypothetical protein
MMDRHKGKPDVDPVPDPDINEEQLGNPEPGQAHWPVPDKDDPDKPLPPFERPGKMQNGSKKKQG